MKETKIPHIVQCKYNIAKQVCLRIPPKHCPTNVVVFSVKSKGPPKCYQLTVHDVAGHGSRDDVDLEYEYEQVENSDRNELQEQVEWYCVPNIRTVGALNVETSRCHC